MNPTTPLIGEAVTGLTNPTFTLTDDIAPSPNGEQVAVTVLGGTQTGFSAHSVDQPFTLSWFKPSNLKPMPAALADAQGYVDAPKNVYKYITRKGVLINTNYGASVATITTTISVPVGSVVQDAASLKSMLSAHIGLLKDDPDAINSTMESGVL